MTAQIPDKVFYQGEQYSLIGVRGGELITPQQFGMQPQMLHTACYRGFYATYEITDDLLYLRELTLREQDDNYLPIAGSEPQKERYQATYHNLSLAVPFNGELRLAKDFIQELYIHMGYQKASAFKTVLDITLEGGHVIAVVDRSKEMEKMRGAFNKRFKSGEISQGINEAFSLDMDLE